jgi:hypothetical protein
MLISEDVPDMLPVISVMLEVDVTKSTMLGIGLTVGGGDVTVVPLDKVVVVVVVDPLVDTFTSFPGTVAESVYWPEPSAGVDTVAEISSGETPVLAARTAMYSSRSFVTSSVDRTLSVCSVTSYSPIVAGVVADELVTVAVVPLLAAVTCEVEEKSEAIPE